MQLFLAVLIVAQVDPADAIDPAPTPAAPDVVVPAPVDVADPADGARFDVDALRALRGKQLVVRLADDSVVEGGLLEVSAEQIVLVDAAGTRVRLAPSEVRSYRELVVRVVPNSPPPPDEARPVPWTIAAGAATGGATACAMAGGVFFATAQDYNQGIGLAFASPCVGGAAGACVGVLAGERALSPLAVVVIVAGAGAVGTLGGVAGASIGYLAGGYPAIIMLGGAVGSGAGAALGGHFAALIMNDAEEP